MSAVDLIMQESTVLLFLLNDNYDIKQINKDGQTCLHHACIDGYMDVVNLLISKGIDIFIKDNINKTALEYAFENNHIDIAKKLLDIGLKTNMDKIIELFVSCFPKGPNIHKGIDEEDETYSNTDLGIFLIDNGLSPDSLIDGSKSYRYSFISDGCTIFGHICYTGYKRMLNYMIIKGATINKDFINSEYADCPLTEACIGNFSEIVSILLKNGADPYRNQTECQTPLMIACTDSDDRGPNYPNTKIIKMLIEAGANVNIRSCYGHSGLYWLINGWNRVFDDNIYDAIEFLLENGADINEIDEENDNNTLLMSHPDDYRLISILIKYGPNLDLIKEDGDSILHLTTDEEIVKLLIENGANYNIKDSEGDTILHSYAYILNIEMCEYIISVGGNSLEKNNDNETVFDVIGKHYDDIEPFIGPIEKDSDMDRICKLTDEQKNYCIEIFKRAREKYLDKVRRDENWKRRKDFMMVLIKHGFKDESYDVVKDTSEKIPGVLRNKEYLVKKIFTVPKRTVNESIKNGESCENIMSFL